MRYLALAADYDGTLAHHGRVPSELPTCAGKRVLLLPDQGLGDHLFFLRFAPAFRSRAAHVAFACPPKLLALLKAGSAVDELRLVSDDQSGFDMSLPVGDLPRLLAADDTPAPLAVSAAPERVAGWRERLATLGPPPYVGVTWRAGTKAATEPSEATRTLPAGPEGLGGLLTAGSCRTWARTRRPATGEVRPPSPRIWSA